MHREHPDDTERALDLARALGFTGDDLAANRRGHLSPVQRFGLTKSIDTARGWSKASAVLTLALVTLPLGLTLLFSSSRESLVHNLSEPDMALRFAIVMGALALLIGGAVFWSYRHSRSPGILALRYVEGEARCSVDHDGEWGDLFYIRIGGIKFAVLKPVHDAFTHGRHYRLYYVEHWPVPVMVSAETLG